MGNGKGKYERTCNGRERDGSIEENGVWAVRKKKNEKTRGERERETQRDWKNWI